MFKTSIWLTGLLVFLITHSRLASPSAILEYRSTVVPDIEEIKALERSKEFTSAEVQSSESPKPSIHDDTETEPALVGEYYDAPEAVLTEPEYVVVDTSNPESIEVVLADEHTLAGDHEISSGNSKLLAVLLENSHTTQETLEKNYSAEPEILDAPAQIESGEEIAEVTDATEEPNTVVEQNEESNVIEGNEEPNAIEENEEPNVIEGNEEPNAIEGNEEPNVNEENEEHHAEVGESVETKIAIEENEEHHGEVVENEEPKNVIGENEDPNVIEENEEHRLEIEENEEPKIVMEENEDPKIVVEENEEPKILIEENEEPIEEADGNAESKIVEENEEPIIVVPLENEESTSVESEENGKPNHIVEENDETTPVIIKNEEETSVVEENEEPSGENNVLTEGTEQPSTVTEDQIVGPNELTEGSEGPPAEPEVLDVLEDSEEQSNEGEPDSAEKALEKEVNDIIAAMAAKNELAKSEVPEGSSEETEPNAVEGDKVLVPISLPRESNSKEMATDNSIAENEPSVKADEHEDNVENSVIIFDESNPTESLVPDVSKEVADASELVEEESTHPETTGVESLLSKVLAIFSTQSTPEQPSSMEIVVERSEKDASLEINPTASESLVAEPASDESDRSGTLSEVINKVLLMKRVLLAFSTQTTPEENNPSDDIGEPSSAEIISESNPTEPTIEESVIVDDRSSLSQVFNKVRLMTKALSMFSTQATPEENGSAEAILENGSTETTKEDPVIVDDRSTLSQVFNKVRLMTKALSMFSTQATPEENGSADAILENGSSESVLEQTPNEKSAEEKDSEIAGASVETVQPSEVPLVIPESESDVKNSDETPSEAEEATVDNRSNEQEVAAAILPEVESTEEIKEDENEVAGPLESSENGHNIVVISSSENDDAEKPISERDANEIPVVFEAGEESKRDEISGENANRIQYMESKMTVTFVNDGDDYANDAIEGTITPVIAPDDDSEEATPTPDADGVEAAPSSDEDEETDGEATEAPIIKLKASSSSSSSSSSSESKENEDESSKSSSSESDELELPMPVSTDAAETGSAPAPEINSDESDEDVSTTAITNAEAEDAETVDEEESNETKEKSVSEKILNAVVDDLINAVAGKAETADNTVTDNDDATSAAPLTTFDRTTFILGGVLMCLSFMSFQEF